MTDRDKLIERLIARVRGTVRGYHGSDPNEYVPGRSLWTDVDAMLPAESSANNPRLSEMVAACKESGFDIMVCNGERPRNWEVYMEDERVADGRSHPDPITAIRRLTTPAEPPDPMRELLDKIEKHEADSQLVSIRDIYAAADAARAAMDRPTK